MTSRQRILTALNHIEPDRVPIDFSGHRSSGVAAIAYPKLRKHLGLPARLVRVYDVIQQLAIIDEDVLKLFGIDTIELGRGFLLEEKDWNDWLLPDGTACKIPYFVNIEQRAGDWYLLADDGRELGIQKKGSLYFEQIHFPLMDHNIESDDFSDLQEQFKYTTWTGVPHPGGHLPLDQQGLSEMTRRAKELRKSTERAIIGLFGGNLFEIGQFLYRNDKFMMLLAGEPKWSHRFLDKLVEVHLANLERFLKTVGEYIDIILFGDDLGMQTGSMMSPKMYQEFFKPRHKLLWNRAKELADVKVMLHCCGSVRELIPDLIEAGLDAINPVQINCAGMDAAQLKAEFGRDLTFWGGGCDTRDVLPNGTPKQVAEHVKEQVRLLSPGGGFVFQQVHNIMTNVPPENIVAMFNAVNDLS